MRRIWLACFLVLPWRLLWGENFDPVAIGKGAALYAAKCAPCHGKDAHGGEGPDLYRSRLVLMNSGLALFAAIRNGIPGTEMPPSGLDDGETRQIVSYLYSLTRPGSGPPVPGDPEAGKVVFAKAGCGRCHMAGGQGSAVGPDLSSVALRLTTAQIRQAILDPDAIIGEGYRTVTVSLKDGRRIRGVLKNEDNFSLQIMQPNDEWALLDRGDAADIRYERRSLMPNTYRARLSGEQLQNLLTFLDRQRAPFARFEVTFQNY